MRQVTGRTTTARVRPNAHAARTPGSRAATPDLSPDEAPAPPAADTDTARADADGDFLRALRAPRYRFDEAPFSDPLTAAISRFTGIASPYPAGP
ncbi:hypothetical protein [Streptomyces sp. CAS3]